MKSNILILVGIILLIIVVIALVGIPKVLPPDKPVCYDLPQSADPMIFGPKYWQAFHDLSHRIPCGMCRGFAEKFVIFFHDTVNMKLGKPLYDKDNFDYFTKLFADIHAGKDVFKVDLPQPQ